MHTVLTLICNPAEPRLSERGAGRLLSWLDEYDWNFGPFSRAILSEGVAEDYSFSCDGERHAALAAAARDFLAGAPIDVVVQPAEGRRKRLLVADMDSTVIAEECLDELADFAGKKTAIAAITERAMRGEIDFERALLARLALLKGLPVAALDETFRNRITLRPGARTLVATMKKFGAATGLVSGGFTYFTERVAAAAGFDAHDANTLVVENGALAGDVVRPVKNAAAKEATLLRLAAAHGVALAETLAVGDGANDLAMLARAGLGVAYRAKPAVAAAAAARIDHGDLTALLYLQGITQTEFATP